MNTNDEEGCAALMADAEERLLDAGLQDVLAAPALHGDADLGVASGGVGDRGRPWRPLLAAAALLLGVGVVALVLVEQRSNASKDELQGPPVHRVEIPLVTAIGAAGLAGLDPDVVGIRLVCVSPSDLELLTEFSSLQALQVTSYVPSSLSPLCEPGEWAAAGGDAFLPLLKLGKLDTVSILRVDGLDPADMRVLSKLPHVRSLELNNVDDHLVDAAMAGLDMMARESGPGANERRGARLHTLRLNTVGLSERSFEVLLRMTGLEELDIAGVHNLHLLKLGRMAALRDLRVLRMQGVGTSQPRRFLLREEGQPARPDLTRFERRAIPGAIAKALAGMPKLRELSLVGSVVGPEVFRALGPALRQLDIKHSLGLDTEALMAIRAAAIGVTDFAVAANQLSPRPMEGGDRPEYALYELLPELPLQRLSWIGPLPVAAQVAIRKCRGLEVFEWAGTPVDESTFSFLGELPMLRESRRNGQRFRHKR